MKSRATIPVESWYMEPNEAIPDNPELSYSVTSRLVAPNISSLDMVFCSDNIAIRPF